MSGLERIAFFGTPSFAVPTLDALAAAGIPPVVVVSQPSRPRGRGRRSEPPPVAVWAQAHDVLLWQPPRVRAPDFLERFRAMAADVAVVVAFGQIFPVALLELPRLGCVNLHASLLPRYRGAAPIAAAIAAGDTATGVSTMLMEAGLDTGPVLLQESVDIEPEENAEQLGARLARIGADLMVTTLRGLDDGSLRARPQDGSLATLAPRLEKSDGRIDWTQPARRVHDRIRAMTPWPGATTTLRGEPLKVIEARLLEGGATAPAGSVLGRRQGLLAVSCGDGSAVGLLRVQRPGRRISTGDDLLNGERIEPGERLGEP